MNSVGTGVGLIMTVVWFFLVIAGIMAIFIPFWVYRIRNEVIGTNKRLDELIKLAGGDPIRISQAPVNFAKPTKVCPKCGTANRIEDTSCMNCGGLI